MAKQLNVDMRFSADTSQAKKAIQDLQNTLSNLSILGTQASTNGFTKQIADATIEAHKLKAALNEATNIKTGTIDLSKLQQSLQKAGSSIQQVSNSLINMGPIGQKAFQEFAAAIAQAQVPTLRLNGLFSELWTTLKNVARFQLSSSIIHGLVGGVSSAYHYAQNLNTSLNNISIVTGQNADQMARFAREANAAAKSLSSTTLDYTNASLIYYQQGLDEAAVKARTDVTVKLANVSRQNAEEVSNQMTAIWNNFDDGSKSMEYFADVITALGATTASSSQEIAAGLEKFAPIAGTIGLSYEKASAALATIVATTRQSADTVGTGLRTIFSRFDSLKLGETLEDGVDLNKYTKAMQTIGVNVLDANGKLKDMDTILDDVAQNWEKLDKTQKTAFATTVGGVRQYTNLMALFDNWDKVQENMATALNSEGTLDEQAERYAKGWEAARNRVQTALEGLYDTLVDEGAFIKLSNALEKTISFVDKLVRGLGGVHNILGLIAAIVMKMNQGGLSNLISNVGYNIASVTGIGQKQAEQMRTNIVNQAINTSLPTGASAVQLAESKAMQNQLKLQQVLNKEAGKYNTIQKQVAQSLVEQQRSYDQMVVSSQKELQKLQNRLAIIRQTKNTTGLTQTQITDLTNREAQIQNDILILTGEIRDQVDNQDKSYQNIVNSLSNINSIQMSGADMFAGIVSGATSAVMAFSMWENAINSLGDDSKSVGEKLSAIFTSILFSIPMATNAITSYNNILQGSKNIIESVNLAQKNLNILNTSAGDIQAILNSQETVENKIIALKNLRLDEETASRLVNKGSIESEKASLEAATASQLKYNAAKLISKGLLLGIAAAIAVAVIAYKVIKKAQEEHLKQVKEEAETSAKNLETINEEVKANQELIKSYEDAKKAWEDGTGSKEQLKEAAEKVAQAYKIENEQLYIAAGRYDLLTEAITRAKEAELKRQQTTAKTALTKASNYYGEIAGKDGKGYAAYHDGFYSDYTVELMGGVTDQRDDLGNYTSSVFTDQYMKEAVNYLLEAGLIDTKLVNISTEDGLEFIAEKSQAGYRALYETIQMVTEKAEELAGGKPLDEESYQGALNMLADMAEAYNGIAEAQDAIIQSGFDLFNLRTDTSQIKTLENYNDFIDGLIGTIDDSSLALDEATKQKYAEDYARILFPDLTARRDAMKLIAEDDQANFVKWLDEKLTEGERKTVLSLILSVKDEDGNPITLAEVQNLLGIHETEVELSTRENNIEKLNTAVQNIDDNKFNADEFYNQVITDGIFNWKDYGIESLYDFLLLTPEEQKNIINSVIKTLDSTQARQTEALQRAQQQRQQDIENAEAEVASAQLALDEARYRRDSSFNDNDILILENNLAGLKTEYSKLEQDIKDKERDIEQLRTIGNENLAAVSSAYNSNLIARSNLSDALNKNRESYRSAKQEWQQWTLQVDMTQKKISSLETEITNLETQRDNIVTDWENSNIFISEHNGPNGRFITRRRLTKKERLDELKELLDQDKNLRTNYNKYMSGEGSLDKNNLPDGYESNFYTQLLSALTSSKEFSNKYILDENENVLISEQDIGKAARYLMGYLFTTDKESYLDKIQYDFSEQIGYSYSTKEIKTILDQLSSSDTIVNLIQQTQKDFGILSDTELSALTEEYENLSNEYKEIQQQVKLYNTEIETKNRLLEQTKLNQIVYQSELKNAQDELDRLDKIAADYQAQIDTLDTTINAQEQTLSSGEYSNQAEIDAAIAERTRLEEELANIRTEIDAAQEDINHYNDMIAEADGNVNDLETKLQEAKDRLAEAQARATSIAEYGIADENFADWLANFKSNLELENLDYTAIRDYAQYLIDIGTFLREDYETEDDWRRESLEFAKAIKLLNQGFNSLNSNGKTWLENLKSMPKESDEAHQAVTGLGKALQDITGLDADTFNYEWLTDENNQQLIDDLVNGVDGALKQLQAKLGSDRIASILNPANGWINSEDFQQDMNLLSELYNDFLENEFPDLEIGASIDDTAFYEQLEKMVRAGEITLDDMNDILSGIGMEVETEEITLPEDFSATQLQSGTVFSVDGKEYTYAGNTAMTAQGGTTVTVLKGTKYKANQKSSSSSSGGGGGGSNKKKEPPKPDRSSRYHRVNALQSINSRRQQAAQDTVDRTVGSTRIAQLQRQIKLEERSLELSKEKLKEAQEYLKVDKADMEQALKDIGLTAQIGEDGIIDNYQQLALSLFNKEKELVDQYNQGIIDDDKYDEEKQKLDDAKEAMENYEETIETAQEEAEKLADSILRMLDLQLEKIQYDVEFKVGLDEADLSLVEHLYGKIEDDVYSTAEAIALLGKEQEILLDEAKQYEEEYSKLMQQLQDNVNLYRNMDENSPELQALLQKLGLTYEEWKNLGDEEMTNYLIGADVDNVFSDLTDKMLELDSKMDEIVDKINEKVINAFNELYDKEQQQIDIFDHYTTVLDNLSNIADLTASTVGAATARSIQNIMRDTKITNQNNRLSGSYSLYKQMVDERSKYEQLMAEATTDAQRKLYEDLAEAAREKERETLEQWQSDLTSALEIIREKAENTMNEAIENFRNSFYNGFVNEDYFNSVYDKAKDIEDSYVQDYERLYRMSELEHQSNKLLDKLDNPKYRKEVLAFQERVNQYKQAGVKISQNQIDAEQKWLDLIQARIALEDAQNAKSIVRLQRDNEGNWGYVYTNDADEIENAEAEVQKALYEYQKSLDDSNKEILERVQRFNNDYADSMEKLKDNLLAGLITEDEYNAEVAHLQELAQQQAAILKEQSDWFYEHFGATHDEMLELYNVDDGHLQSWDETPLARLLGYSTIDEAIAGVQPGIENLAQTTLDAWHQMLDEQNETLGIVDTSVNTLTTDMGNWADAVEDASSRNREAVTDLADSFDNVMLESIQAVQAEWDKWLGQLQQTQNELLNLVAIINEYRRTLNFATDNTGNNPVDIPTLEDVLGASQKPDIDYPAIENYLSKENVMTEDYFSNILGSKEDLLQSIQDYIKLQAQTASYGFGNITPGIYSNGYETIEQNVHIDANFPNVVNSSEIEEAFENLVNKAAQYANRKRQG